MTISIIIPAYNHAEVLVACVKALTKQTLLPQEIIVVDDGSSDHPRETLERAGLMHHVSQWLTQTNQGAPVARNAGFAVSSGEAVMFLDADAVLRSDALALLAQTLEQDKKAAFAYSAFRFGGKLFRSQVFSVEALKRGNFIHTSALIRREAFPMFDPALKKFQDWDLWLHIVERGGYGVYVPELLLTIQAREHGGMSRWLPAFAYALPLKWMGYEPEAVRSYREAKEVIFLKHGFLRKEPTRTLHEEQTHPSLLRRCSTSRRRAPEAVLRGVCAWASLFCEKPWIGWGMVGVGMLGLSSVGVGNTFGGWFALGVAFLVGIIAAWRPSLALTWMFFELIIGSKGRWLALGADAVNDGGVSVRILSFAAFFLGWSVWLLRTRSPLSLRRKNFLIFLIPLVLVLAWGFLRGAFLHQPFLLADANAWGYLALLLPLALARTDSCEKDTSPLAGVAFITLFTLALWFVFSHTFSAIFLEVLYRWIRQSGLGEITRAGDGIYRIFFASQIFLVVAWLFMATRSLRDHLPLGWRTWCAWSALGAALLASFSRSFWMGLVGSAGFLACLVWRSERWSWTAGLRITRRLLGSVIGAFVMLIVLVFVPIFRGAGGFDEALASRFRGGEAAVSSRWALLPVMKEGILRHPMLGSGFGATLTYRTNDPRIVEKTGGLYTTYAFEWGWLDLWYKLGIFGVLAVVWTLGMLAYRARFLQEEERFAVWSALLALAIIHVFTPYLNHPLGLGILMFLAIKTVPRNIGTREALPVS